MIMTESSAQIVGRALRDPAREPVRILCVEDNDLDFFLIRAHLQDAGFTCPLEIRHARSMAEALRFIQAGEDGSAYEIVLLDLSLPDSQGVETYRQLRAAAPFVAVAILSGNNDQELALDLVQHGAQDYLPKDTLTPDLLMRCITYAMKRQLHRVEMQRLTDRLRSATEELKTTQKQLIQSEKAESLGRLASSVAHEVKNPLGVIQMGLDFLAGQLPNAGNEINRTLDLMQDAVTRADSVIHDMLDFSRSDERPLEHCDVNNIIQITVRMLKHEIDRQKMTLHLELANTPLWARCDRNGIEQVLINLVMNALQAMEKGKGLTIRTKEGQAPEPPHNPGTRELSNIRTGEQVVIIEVQDQGTGIPDEIMTRVFDPFFTTKPTGEGTGLGLSVCRNIIELHRGRLRVTNIKEPHGLLVSIILKAELPPDSERKNNNGPLSEMAAPQAEHQKP